MTQNLSLKSPLKSEPKQGMNSPSKKKKKSQTPRVNTPKKNHNTMTMALLLQQPFQQSLAMAKQKYSEGVGGSLPRFGPSS